VTACSPNRISFAGAEAVNVFGVSGVAAMNGRRRAVRVGMCIIFEYRVEKFVEM